MPDVNEVAKNTASAMNQKSLAITRLAERADAALDKLPTVRPYARSVYQNDFFQIAETLLKKETGLGVLYERADRFEAAGLFGGGPWEDASKLQAPLVAGCLATNGVYPVVETLSELRMLAIAKGKYKSSQVSAEEAANFLREVLALNLDLLFPGDTEQERTSSGPFHESNVALFELLADEIDISKLQETVLEEIDQVTAQRPIIVKRVKKMIRIASRMPTRDAGKTSKRLEAYADALSGPSPLSREYPDLQLYRETLRKWDREKLEIEAKTMADAMHETGLVSHHHAILLRFVKKQHADLIPIALGLGEVGVAEFDNNQEFYLRIINVAIHPKTCQAILGLSRFADRGLSTRQEVEVGLGRLVDLDIRSDIKKRLLTPDMRNSGLRANSVLVAGAISVLGLPLGIGQGHQPTCQAARGISLWAQHAPGKLLEYVVSAARDGFVAMSFEGEILKSSELQPGLSQTEDEDLDPVSKVLVPELDRVYSAMMKKTSTRNEDGHKWVNPGLYGNWVPHSMETIFSDLAGVVVSDFPSFVRRFYATHHPEYNDGHALMYPNPVGIIVTNTHGDHVGRHAVSIQRIAEDPAGVLRVYFYNPNNEGRQDWGRGVQPTVSGNGEFEGESSLPFEQFVGRLYAFHFNPYEEGDAFAIPEKLVGSITEEAKSTWGKAYTWD